MALRQDIVENTGSRKPNKFVAIRNDFVLKNDGDRVILYPFDFVESKFFILTPLQGFALSMLDGSREFKLIQKEFTHLLPETEITFAGLLSSLDRMIKDNPTQSGIGREGLFQESSHPITEFVKYDPRGFIVSVEKYNHLAEDLRTRRRLNSPICIMAFYTSRCETKCIYCYADRKHRPEMPLASWKRIIREMQELDIKLISLDGGDIVAREDGIEFLEELIGAGLLFLLSTKAHVGPEEVRRLVSAGFNSKVRDIGERVVQLSVDAWDDEKASLITGSSRFKENISKTFDNFMREGIIPKIKGVLMPFNSDQPLRVVEYFYPRGARRFQFVGYTRSFYHHKEEFFLNPESLVQAREQMEEIRFRYPDIELGENINQFDPYSSDVEAELKQKLWDNRSGCGGGWSMLGIAPDGWAILCEQMAQEEPFFVGDLNYQSIMQVWRGQKMLDFIYPPRDRFAGTICENCDDFEECHWEKGYCYRDAYFSYGTIYEAPPLCPKQEKPGLRLG